MHELSLAQAILQHVEERAAGRPVPRVDVRIGHLRQVVPDSLAFAWEMLTSDTPLEGCQLVVEHVPAVVSCGSCARETTLEMPVLVCGSCGDLDVELRSGEELLVASFEVPQEVG